MDSFKDEILEAVNILEAYAQPEDAIWLDWMHPVRQRLLDILESADESKVTRIHVKAHFSLDEQGNRAHRKRNIESSYPLLHNLKLLYTERNSYSIIQRVSQMRIDELSSKALFFYAGSVFRVVN